MGLDMFLRDSKGHEIIYWRKANHIHLWFVENVQNGKDDCKEYKVDLKKLKELLDIINRILIVGEKEDKRKTIIVKLSDGFDKRLAQELLPTCSGFFFGGTGYDEYYLKDLEFTKKKLDEIFKDKNLKGKIFYYVSS